MSQCAGSIRVLAMFKSWLMLSLVFVAFALNLLTPRTATAQELGWCVREIEQNEDWVVIDHNPECDLRGVVRMYPQKDPDSGETLLMQVQLRSIYAANQTRTVDGKRQRFTVMRGCVAPGKVPAGADEEEKDMCPNGIVNYFSAPWGHRFARIQVPRTRKLTRAEKGLRVAEQTCPLLAEVTNPSDAQKRAMNRCREIFPAVSLTPPPPVETEDHKQLVAAQTNIASLNQTIEGQKTHLASLAPLVKRGEWYWPLMIGVFGLFLYGAGGTIFAVRKLKSIEQQWQDRYNLLEKQRMNASAHRNSDTMPDKKSRDEARKQLEAEYEAKYEKILAEKLASSARQIEELQELKTRLEKARDRAYDDGRADEKKEQSQKAPSASEDVNLKLQAMHKVAESRLQTINERDAKIKEQSVEIQSLQTQLDELNTKIEEELEETQVSLPATADLAEKDLRIAELDAECDQRVQEVQALEQRNTALENEIAALNELSTQHGGLRDEWEAKRKEFEERIADLNSKNKKLALKLNESNSEHANLEGKLVERDIEIRELRARVDRLEANVNSLGQDRPMRGSDEVPLNETLPMGFQAKDEVQPTVNSDPDQSGGYYSLVSQRSYPSTVNQISVETPASDLPDDFSGRPTFVGEREEILQRASESTLPITPSEMKELAVPPSPPPPAFAVQGTDQWEVAWRELVDLLSRIDEHWRYSAEASPETVNQFFRTKVDDLFNAYTDVNTRWRALQERHQAQAVELKEANQQIQQLTQARDTAQAFADGLQKIIDENGPSDQKCARYELQKLEADQRALQAERALQEHKERYGPLEESGVTSVREIKTVQETKLVHWSDIALSRLQLHLAREVASRCQNGNTLDLALSSEEELRMLMIMFRKVQVMSSYEYQMPPELLQLAGQGNLPMLAHVAQWSVNEPVQSKKLPAKRATQRPSAAMMQAFALGPSGPTDEPEISVVQPPPMDEKKSG